MGLCIVKFWPAYIGLVEDVFKHAPQNTTSNSYQQAYLSYGQIAYPFKFTHVLFCVRVNEGDDATASLWRVTASLEGSFLSFHHVSTEAQIQASQAWSQVPLPAEPSPGQIIHSFNLDFSGVILSFG